MNEDLLRFDNEKTLVLIDLETENLCLNFCGNLPWQIGMIKVKGNNVLDSKDFYVKWDRKLNVSKEAARITRFSPKKHEEKAVHIRKLFPTIEDWLDGADHIIGHNILGFDLYLIAEIYRYMGKDYLHLVDKVIDTLSLARGIKLNLPYKRTDNLLAYQYRMLNQRKKGMRCTLKALGQQFGIMHDYDHLHDALVDLELNLKVWNQLKYTVEI